MLTQPSDKTMSKNRAGVVWPFQVLSGPKATFTAQAGMQLHARIMLPYASNIYSIRPRPGRKDLENSRSAQKIYESMKISNLLNSLVQSKACQKGSGTEAARLLSSTANMSTGLAPRLEVALRAIRVAGIKPLKVTPFRALL